MNDWGGKLLGAVGRLAGLLHGAEWSHAPEPWVHPVSADTVRDAIRIGHYLIPHAKMAYSEMGADPALEDAKFILRWVRTRALTSFNKRDLHQATRSRFKRVDALEPPLSVLLAHHYIRESTAEERGSRPGRKQSPVYEVNPFGIQASPQNSQNSVSAAGNAPSEYSEQRSLAPGMSSETDEDPDIAEVF
jgi:hypothetical protein